MKALVRIPSDLVATLYTSKGRFKEGRLKNIIDRSRKPVIGPQRKTRYTKQNTPSSPAAQQPSKNLAPPRNELD